MLELSLGLLLLTGLSSKCNTQGETSTRIVRTLLPVALQSIPGDLYEAAEMDGASGPQKFRHITVTYLRPAMVPYAIYGFVITFNLFFLPYFMTGGQPFGRTEILVTQAYRLAVDRQLLGVAAAFAVYLFFLLLAVTLVTNRLAKATKSYAE